MYLEQRHRRWNQGWDYVVVRATVLCATVLCATVLCATVLCATVLCATVLRVTELHATVLCATVLRATVGPPNKGTIVKKCSLCQKAVLFGRLNV